MSAGGESGPSGGSSATRAPGPVLALDASSRRPGVALLGPAGDDWGVWLQPEGERGTAALAPAVATLLRARGLSVSDLLGVAVGVGPGSYTGLRASIALALGLALPARLPVAGVASVAAAARGALRDDAAARRVLVLLDARRGELYRALYARASSAEGVDEVLAPALVPRAEAEREVADARAATGTAVLHEPVPDPRDVAHLLRGRLLAGGDPPAALRPLYLKASHAELQLQRRAGGG